MHKTSDGSRAEDSVRRFGGVVRSVAGRLARHLPRSVEYADLVQDGMLMLIQLDLSDDHCPDAMAAYVARRARGAMIDALRRLDPIGRDIRRKARAIQVAEKRLSHELGRQPSSREIAAAAGLEIDHYFSVLRDVAAGEHQSSDDCRECAADVGDPLDQILFDEKQREINRAVDRLPSRDSELVISRYALGERMHVSALRHEITESRVCQIQKRAIGSIRTELNRRGVLHPA